MSTVDVAAMSAVVHGEPDSEIVACEAEIRAAQLAADVAALDRLIADDEFYFSH